MLYDQSKSVSPTLLETEILHDQIDMKITIKLFWLKIAVKIFAVCPVLAVFTIIRSILEVPNIFHIVILAFGYFSTKWWTFAVLCNVTSSYLGYLNNETLSDIFYLLVFIQTFVIQQIFIKNLSKSYKLFFSFNRLLSPQRQELFRFFFVKWKFKHDMLLVFGFIIISHY